MLRPGQIFANRYQVERRIAQGGMGAVYAAEHLVTEERVALKVLWPHVLDSRAAAECFQVEARVTARMRSEHVVRVLDAGFDERLGAPFVVMELLHGLTLQALLDKTGLLTPAETVAALRQTASALDRAHGHVDRSGRPAPIVHRDLKPENLFVSLGEAGGACVKVLDFGLGKVLSDSLHLSRDAKGTPLFMACEQFSRGPVTPQLDVWPLGLIAFSLLTGQPYWLASAYESGGYMSLLDEILVRPIVPPTERAAALGLSPPWPPEFNAWFLRCLAREPRARFASAGAAVEALAEAFMVGANLTESTIATAVEGLGRRTELGLRLSPALATAASPSIKPPRPRADVATTLAAGATTLNVSNAPSKGGARVLHAAARALLAGLVVVVAALGVAFAMRSTAGVAATAALGRQAEAPAPAPAPAPAASASAPVVSAPASSGWPAQPSAQQPAPPRPHVKAPRGAEAAGPKAEAVRDAEPQPEVPLTAKPTPVRSIYSEP